MILLHHAKKLYRYLNVNALFTVRKRGERSSEIRTLTVSGIVNPSRKRPTIARLGDITVFTPMTFAANIDIIKRDTGGERIGNIDMRQPGFFSILESFGQGHFNCPLQLTADVMVIMAAIVSTTGSFVVLLYNCIAVGAVGIRAVKGCTVEGALVLEIRFFIRPFDRGGKIKL